MKCINLLNTASVTSMQFSTKLKKKLSKAKYIQIQNKASTMNKIKMDEQMDGFLG